MGRSKQSIPKKRQRATEDGGEFEDEQKKQKAIQIFQSQSNKDIVEKTVTNLIRCNIQAWENLDVLVEDDLLGHGMINEVDSKKTNDENKSSGDASKSKKDDVVDDKNKRNNRIDSSLASQIIQKNKKPCSCHHVLKKPLPKEFDGLGLLSNCFDNNNDDFIVVQQIHELIKEKSKGNWTSWSGSSDDTRKRAYGILSNTLGSKVIDKLDISTPDNTLSENVLNEERIRNKKAIVYLDDDDENNNDEHKELISKFLYDILEPKILKRFRMMYNNFSDDSDSNNDNKTNISSLVQKYLSIDNLISLQPNIHNGNELLPPHVDIPDKDGFGIIIITIGIKGDGIVMLETHDKSKQGKFLLKENEVYMLCGPSRNSCTHGILTTPKTIESVKNEQNDANDSGNTRNGDSSSYRESLNLRFGLHGLTDNDPSPLDVLKYWQ